MPRPPGHPDNSLISTAANHDRWAAVDDRTAATAPARKAFNDTFIRQARERFGDLPAAELAIRAEHLRKSPLPQAGVEVRAGPPRPQGGGERLMATEIGPRRSDRGPDEDRGHGATSPPILADSPNTPRWACHACRRDLRLRSYVRLDDRTLLCQRCARSDGQAIA